MLPSHGHSILTASSKLMEEIKNGQWWWHVWQRNSWELHPPRPGTFSSLQVATRAAWWVTPMVIIFSFHESSTPQDFSCLGRLQGFSLTGPGCLTALAMNPNSCPAAFAEVMRPHCLCSPMGNTEHPRGTHEPGGEIKVPIAPKILQHTADVEEDLRTYSLPADPSVGGTSPLPCSSMENCLGLSYSQRQDIQQLLDSPANKQATSAKRVWTAAILTMSAALPCGHNSCPLE